MQTFIDNGVNSTKSGVKCPNTSFVHPPDSRQMYDMITNLNKSNPAGSAGLTIRPFVAYTCEHLADVIITKL